MNVYTWKLSGGRNGTLPSSIPKAQKLLENWSGFLVLVFPRCPDASVFKILPGFLANPHPRTVTEAQSQTRCCWCYGEEEQREGRERSPGQGLWPLN